MTFRPIPISLKLAAICAASLLPAPGFGADLALPPAPPAMMSTMPAVVAEDGAVLCMLRPGTVFFQHPYTQPFGPLPAGLLVQVIDVPFTRATDLFVRIKAPTQTVYYGYVRTTDLLCD